MKKKIINQIVKSCVLYYTLFVDLAFTNNKTNKVKEK